MTSPRLDDERDLLAAEHALKVLQSDELAQARELQLSSRDFAESVEAWERTLAPIAGEASEQDPHPSLWARIEAALSQAGEQNGQIVQLNRRLRMWQGLSFAASAAAALLLFMLVAPNRGDVAAPSTIANTPVLVASLSSEETGTSLSAAYNPMTHSLLVTPGVLKGAAGHEHELWIIPAGGKPVAVGLIAAGEAQRLQLQDAILPHFRTRSTLAVSVEPVGGSRTGQPTGPIIATGQLSSV